ncbi:MAG: TolC family protein [Candidatus Krumholzibacteriia bacterium]
MPRALPLILPVSALAAALLLMTPAGAAAEAVLRLDRAAALDLARGRGAAVLAGRARATAADGELAAARTWRHNPELELEGGRRRAGTDETFDRFATVSQRLDLAGRGARIDAAARARDAAGAEAHAGRIAALAAVGQAHLAALHAGRHHELATAAAALADRLLDVARRRQDAGGVGALEVNLAAVAAARAAADTARTAARVGSALDDLAGLLGLDPGTPLAVVGDLAWPLAADLEQVRAAAARHPSLPAVAAREAAALARGREAAAGRLPDLVLAAGAGREEGADLVRLGVGLSLPLFSRGSGEAAAAAAEARALAIEGAADARTRWTRAEGAWRRHHLLQAAATAFADRAVATAGNGLDLAETSYRAGRADLDQVLLVQREHLDARRELADLQFEAALAALETAATAGLPPLTDPEETP